MYLSSVDIGGETSQLQKVEQTLSTADGTPMQVLGSAAYEVEISGYVTQLTLVIADISGVDGILGMDFLCESGITINAGQSKLHIQGHTVNLYRDGSLQCARVRLEQKVYVPPCSEIEVKAKIEGNVGSCTPSIIEPIKLLAQKKLLVSRVLIDSEQRETVMSIVNLSDNSVRLQRNTLVGTVQPIESIQEPTPKITETNISSSLPAHLQPLLDNASPELTSQQRLALTNLLIEYQDVFVGPDGRLGRTDLVEHTIDTGSSKPIKLPPRRTSYAQKKIIEEQLDTMLKQDIIEPSVSPYAAPVLLVMKKDGTHRFCVDYRRLNAVTRKDAYPLPRIDTCLESLAGAKWFCTTDLASGYWQCPMERSSQEKTSFATHKGTYSFKVMPFGLCNSPATFSRLMEILLANDLGDKCLCYLDDVIIFGSTFEICLDNLRAVFERYRQANLRLKPNKCMLFQTECSFLGHIVDQNGIRCDPSKVKKVLEWPVPSNVTELRQLLGLVGYYRRFIQNCSTITAPLTKLLKKNTKFIWDSDCQQSFETLKQKLASAPILSYPKYDKGCMVLDTDASLYGIGCVMSQIQDGEERVLAYGSKSLSKSQRRYCTTYRELLAVITFVKEFRHFLWGRHFIIRTDHSSLLWIKNFKEPEGMLARWLTVLDTYDYEIQFRRGSQHVYADVMSRLPHKRCKRDDCPDCKETQFNEKSSRKQPGAQDCSPKSNLVAPIHHSENQNQSTSSTDSATDQIPQTPNPSSANAHQNDHYEQQTELEILPNWLDTWSPEQIKIWQESDDCISKILQLKSQFQEKPPKTEILAYSNMVKALWSLWETLEVHDGILYSRWVTKTSPQGYLLQLIAPQSLRSLIFKQLHSSHLAGHMGRDKTLMSVRRRFYWPGMSADIRRWCKQCDVCARNKRGPGTGKAPLTQFLVGAPLDVIALDIIGPLQTTENGNSFILVLGDYFSKWKEAYPIPDHTALTVADKLVSEFICRFGTVKQIHTDQGREFESHLFAHLCRLLGVEKSRTTPYRPQSDGLVENFNKSLKQMFTHFVNEHQNDWDDYIPFLLLAYRSTIHESTGCTPNLLFLSRELSLPIDLMAGNPSKSQNYACPVEYVEWVRNSMEKCFKFAQSSLEKAASRQKKYYDRGLRPRSYEVGDFIWRLYPPNYGVSLLGDWIGPYKVTAKFSSVTYEIQRTPHSKPFSVHVDHMKPYEGEQPPSMWEVRTADDSSLSFVTPPSVTETDDSSEHSIISDSEPAEVLTDDVSPQSPQAEVLRRSRWGRPIRRPCPYSPTL